MCSNNMTIWKKKQKNSRLKKFIKDFSLFIKECCYIVWSAEKLQKLKRQNL